MERTDNWQGYGQEYGERDRDSRPFALHLSCVKEPAVGHVEVDGDQGAQS